MQTETPESIQALREYFAAHERATAALTTAGVAEALAAANRARDTLRNLDRIACQ